MDDDLSDVPMTELRNMLLAAEREEKQATFDDCHASYVRRGDAARAEKRRVRAEIERRAAHHEAINGR